MIVFWINLVRIEGDDCLYFVIDDILLFLFFWRKVLFFCNKKELLGKKYLFMLIYSIYEYLGCVNKL